MYINYNASGNNMNERAQMLHKRLCSMNAQIPIIYKFYKLLQFSMLSDF